MCDFLYNLFHQPNPDYRSYGGYRFMFHMIRDDHYFETETLGLSQIVTKDKTESCMDSICSFTGSMHASNLPQNESNQTQINSCFQQSPKQNSQKMIFKTVKTGSINGLLCSLVGSMHASNLPRRALTLPENTLNPGIDFHQTNPRYFCHL